MPNDAEILLLSKKKRYPACHRSITLGGCLDPVVFGVLFVILATSVTCDFIYYDNVEWHGVLSVLALGFLFVRSVLPVRPKIIPYFSERLMDDTASEAHCSGHTLAAQCGALDEICAKSGARPVSDYGFLDDLEGDELIWFEPAEMIKTFETLAAAIRQLGSKNEMVDKLRNEIDVMLRALYVARDRNINVCLHLRYGNCYSGLEQDNRIGSHF